MLAGLVENTIVDIQQLQKTYRSWSWGRSKTIEAVRGVSLQACAGEVFGLLGPNGAGKTTLIKMLLGVVNPSDGRAKLFDQPIGSVAARKRVGYLPESLRVDRHHTARSALRYYGRLSRMSSPEIKRRIDELLSLVGLTGRDRESVRRFSKGMYQRLGLAQALMHDPDLLVLDEPTDGLDPVGRNEVRAVIERLRDSGKTIFLNSHILQEVELVCTRVAVMARGKIRAMGTLGELAAQHGAHRLIARVCPTGKDCEIDESRLEALRQMVPRVLDPDASWEIDHATDREMAEIIVSDPRSSQIDQLVDQIRSQKWSIRHLEVTQASLEESFMRLVKESEKDT